MPADGVVGGNRKDVWIRAVRSMGAPSRPIEGRNPLSDTTDVTSGVTDVQSSEEAGSARRRRPGTGLTAMLLPELQAMASSLGISGTARMRKGELIAAIQDRQAGDGRVPGPRGDARGEVPARAEAPRDEVRAEVREDRGRRDDLVRERQEESAEDRQPRGRRGTRQSGAPEPRVDDRAEVPSAEVTERVS